jgi:hypothetical protein
MAETHEIKTKKKKKKTIPRTNETKIWIFEKISKSYKLLAKLTKRRMNKTQINKIRDEKGDITTNDNKTQRIMREYFENLHSNKVEI